MSQEWMRVVAVRYLPEQHAQQHSRQYGQQESSEGIASRRWPWSVTVERVEPALGTALIAGMKSSPSWWSDTTRLGTAPMPRYKHLT